MKLNQFLDFEKVWKFIKHAYGYNSDSIIPPVDIIDDRCITREEANVISMILKSDSMPEPYPFSKVNGEVIIFVFNIKNEKTVTIAFNHVDNEFSYSDIQIGE